MNKKALEETQAYLNQFTLTESEKAYQRIYGKRAYNKKDRDNFTRLMSAYLHEKQVIQTIYGPLVIRGIDASERLLTVYTAFEKPIELPGKKIEGLYGPFTADGSIYGVGFNGYSGKWNHHFSFTYGWSPADAATRILQAIDSIRIHPNQAA